MASVYVHFPWCLSKCPYCDFVSYAKKRDEIDHAGYANAVLCEAEARARYVESRGRPFELGSVFFGGGTPSLWDSRELGRVLARLTSLFPVSPDLEVTVECNPTSLDRERASALARAGVGRLSIGTQSLRQAELTFLGRLHDPDGARRAIEGALASGVPRLSTDLIFGLPDQSPDDARLQALSLADLGLTHLSCYQLTIEPGTRFGELARRGRLPLADDGRVAEAFLAIDLALRARGFSHYEISNFARPGEEARHNLGYWRGEEYLGLGCAAYGFFRDAAGGLRYRNAIEPAMYMQSARTVRSDLVGQGDGLSCSSERLDAEALLRERIMLGLRLTEGVDLGHAAADLGVSPFTRERERALEGLALRGRIVREGERLRIPRAGWLFADDTAARLF